jgi:alkanesulfonate monooxygenase SsuD/methylene tetrahydromethanopterin reductase-like flavin-dependent oxidoreductase (luciferase family)
MEKLLNVAQAAEILGLSKAWVRDHAAPRPGKKPRRTPVIPVVRFGNGLRDRLMFVPADLQAFMESNRVDGERKQ